MYVVGWLHSLTLEKWPSVGGIICILVVLSPSHHPNYMLYEFLCEDFEDPSIVAG